MKVGAAGRMVEGGLVAGGLAEARGLLAEEVDCVGRNRMGFREWQLKWERIGSTSCLCASAGLVALLHRTLLLLVE